MYPSLLINMFVYRRFKHGTKLSKTWHWHGWFEKDQLVWHNAQEFWRRVVESSACGGFVNGSTHSSSQTIPAFLDFFPSFQLQLWHHYITNTHTNRHTQTDTHTRLSLIFSSWPVFSIFSSSFGWLVVEDLVKWAVGGQIWHSWTTVAWLAAFQPATFWPDRAHWPGESAAHILHNDPHKMKHQGQKGWKNFPSLFYKTVPHSSVNYIKHKILSHVWCCLYFFLFDIRTCTH